MHALLKCLHRVQVCTVLRQGTYTQLGSLAVKTQFQVAVLQLQA